MTQPLPDAEWWPLKWSSRKAHELPNCTVHGYLIVNAEGEEYRSGYCVYKAREVGNPPIYDAVQENIPDLLTLRCFLLKLAYPGGKYG